MKFFLHALHFYSQWTHLLLLLGLPHLIGAQTYTASGLPQAIEDGGSFICWECPGAPLVSTLNVPLNLTITDARQIRISLNLSHPEAGELQVQLITPNRVVIPLIDRMHSGMMNPCGDDRAFNGNNTLTFVSDAAFPMNDPRFSGMFLPTVSGLGTTGNLNNWVGVNTNGNWELRIVDGTIGNVGSLISWSIAVALAPSIAINTNNTVICAGTSATFTATPTNGGTSPSYQWQKNGINVGSNSPTYTDATLVNADVLTCVLTSNEPNAFPTTATSLPIAMTVTVLPTVNAVANQTVMTGTSITAIPFLGTATTFSWVNDNPNINLPATGTGDLPAFIASNPSNTAATATITVTPSNSATPSFAYIPSIDGSVSSANPQSHPNGTSRAATAESVISVINTSTNAIVAVIPITGVLIGTSVSPNGKRLYVTNWASSSIEVINTQTRNVISTIRVGNNPTGVAVSPNNERVYVANSNSVSVIDALTNTVIQSIAGGGEGICISPDGNRVYVTNTSAALVTIINAATNAILSTISVSTFPSGICISPNGGRLYVTHIATGRVSVINTTTNAVIATIPVDIDPKGIAINPNGTFVYVTNYVSGTVSVINTATNTVVNTIIVGTNPWGVSFTPQGNAVYVANNGSNSISVINTATNTVTSTIAADGPTAFGNFITAAQAGCVGTPTSFSITVNPPPLRIIASPSNIIAEGTPVTFSAILTSGAGAFLWKKNGRVMYISDFGGLDLTYTDENLRENDLITCELVQLDDQENFVALATSNTITMIVVPLSTVTIHISARSPTLCSSTAVVTFTAMPVNEGVSPSYQWKKNGLNVGSNSTTYTDATWADQDSIACWMTYSNALGVNIAKSSTIIMTVLTPSVPAIADQTICVGQQTNAISLSGSNETTYTWTNSNPNIGLAASGTGNIPAFTTLNNTNAATTATITITPTQRNVLEYAYIPNHNANTVSVLNTAANLIVATIPVGTNPFGVAVSPNGERVYITNEGSNNVSVINTATNVVIATLSVGASPFEVMVSADGQRIYVSAGDNIVVINAATYGVIATIPAQDARGIAINTRENRIYVVHDERRMQMSVIDGGTNTTIIDRSSMTRNWEIPYDIVSSPDGNRIYITAYNANKVYVIDPVTYTAISTIPVTTQPLSMAISPDGSRLYVSNRNSEEVSVINTATDVVIASIVVGRNPHGISVSSDGRYIYVANESSHNISVISAATNSVISTIQVGASPKALGNFLQTSSLVCSGTPATFSVTVNPLLTPSVTVAAVPSNIITRGTNVTFTATPTNGGTPAFQWKKNNTNVGTNSATYTDANLEMNDVITCELTSNATCAVPTAAISTPINMVVTVTPEVNIAVTTGSQTICAGTSVTFTATSTYGGTSPIYQWKKNGNPVGTNSSTYTDATLANADVVTCDLTSNELNASPTTVISNRLPMIVSPVPTIAGVSDQTLCHNNLTTAVAFTGTHATHYTWTNSNPNIGLAATGTGDIAAFLANNNTQSRTNATITVTPKHNGTTGYAYIAHYNNSSISALNTATNTVDATIAVGANPENIAVSPDGSRVYVVNARDHTVSVMSTATHSLLATVGIARYSSRIAISPDGSQVYVSSELGRISVINTTTYAVSTIIVGSWPYGMAVSPDGNQLYVADKRSSRIYAVNTATNAIETLRTDRQYTENICIHPDGSYIYATGNPNKVLAVNTQTLAITIIEVGSSPVGISANPNGRYIYVANSSSNTVSVISTVTHTVVATIAVGDRPQGVSLSRDGKNLYVTNYNSSTVSCIDVATHTVVATIPNLARASSIGNFVTTTQMGCTGTPTSFTVTVNPNLTPSVTVAAVPSNIITRGTSVTFTATPTHGGTPAFQWKKNNTNVGTNSATYTDAVLEMNDVITCELTSNATCAVPTTAISDPINMVVTVTPEVNIAITTGSQTICAGTSVTFTATPTHGGTSPIYQWTKNGIPVGTNSATYTDAALAHSDAIRCVMTSNEPNASPTSVTSLPITMIVNALPIATISNTMSTTFCQGGNVVLNANTGNGWTYQWKWDGNGIAANANAATFTAANAGSYTVVVTDANTCTNTSNPISVIVNALPIATISNTTSTTFCQGENVVLNANTGDGLAYQWHRNGTPMNGATNAHYTATTEGSYTIRVTNANHCSNTSIPTNVTVHSLPAATITPASVTTFCQGGNVILNASSVVGGTYQWFQNGTALSFSDRSYVATASGNYSVLVTDANHCAATSQSTTILVNPLPIPVLTASSDFFCQGDSVQLQIRGGATYLWSNYRTDSTFWAKTGGNYTVTVTSDRGCTAMDSKQLIMNSLPNALINHIMPTTFCQGENVVLNADRGDGWTYQWHRNGTPMNGATNAHYTAITEGAYTVGVTNANHCTATSQPTTVLVNPLPIPVLTASSDTFCQGDSVQLRIRGGATYLWSNHRTDTDFWAKTAGNYTVTVTSDRGCTAMDSKRLIMNSLPNALITHITPTTFCQGENVVLNADRGDGWSYQWHRNGTPMNGATNAHYTAITEGAYTVGVTNTNHCTATSQSTTVLVNPLPIPVLTASSNSFCQGDSVQLRIRGGATYLWSNHRADSTFWAKTGGNYTVTVTNDRGCTAMDSKLLIMNSLPNAHITHITPTTFCQGGNVVLNANLGEGLAYQWHRNGTPMNGATNAHYTATTEGSYTIRVTNANHCSNISIPNYVIINELPIARITPASATTFCQGGNVILNAPSTPGLTYQWRRNETALSFSDRSYVATASGNYSVLVTDANHCAATSQPTTVLVNPLPIPVLTASSDRFCSGDSVQLRIRGGVTYLWSNNRTDTAFWAKTGDNYTVTVTSDSGCTAVDSKQLIMNSLPNALITHITPTTFCQGGNVVLNANLGDGLSYQWHRNGTPMNGATDAHYTATTEGDYTVGVTNANHCSNISTANAVIVHSLPIASMLNATNILCNGDKSTLTVGGTGGLAPYQYSANSSNYQNSNLLELGAGNHYINVRDNHGCTSLNTALTLSQPDILTITTPTAAPLNCYDSFTNLQAIANGGTLPYQYSLTGFVFQTPNQFSVQGGTYQMLVRDANGCRTASSLHQVVRPADLVLTTVTNPIKCWGDTTYSTIQVANAVAPIQYTLNGVSQNNDNLYKGLRIGTYPVRVLDSRGCTKATTLTITQPPLLTGNVQVDTMVCKGKLTPLVVTATGGTGNISYRLNAGAFQNNTFMVGAGEQKVQIRDANQCLQTLPTVLVEDATAKIGDLRHLKIHCHDMDMRIYPNPVVDILSVDFKIAQSGVVKIVVYNALGDLIAHEDYQKIEAGSYTTSWDTANWASDMVRVCLEVDGVCVQVTSVMIVH